MINFAERNQEVTFQVLKLLPTIEDALYHMQLQLEELRLEESMLLFQDTALAIEKIAHYTSPLMSQGKDLHLYKNSIREMRESVVKVIDAYEENNILAIQTYLTQSLIPAFISWQQELEGVLRSSLLN